MEIQKSEKIARFLSDKLMSDTIYEVLLAAFLEKQPHQDVQTLAASKIAIDNLLDAWKDLQKYKSEAEREIKPQANVGI